MSGIVHFSFFRVIFFFIPGSDWLLHVGRLNFALYPNAIIKSGSSAGANSCQQMHCLRSMRYFIDVLTSFRSAFIYSGPFTFRPCYPSSKFNFECCSFPISYNIFMKRLIEKANYKRRAFLSGCYVFRFMLQLTKVSSAVA